jgi:hypothetical protein
MVYVLCVVVKFFFEVRNYTGLKNSKKIHRLTNIYFFMEQEKRKETDNARGVDPGTTQMNRRHAISLPSITEKTVPRLTCPAS